MKTFTRLFVALLIVAGMQLTNAQDIHFSQFYASPLTLNPAMTGNLNGSYRAAVIYRNQWSSIPAPYSTVAASFDMPVVTGIFGTDHVGAGIALYNDRAGDGQLNDLTAMASIAYHKALDQEARYFITVGGQAGWTQKSVDFTKLLFENQIVNFEFDPTAPNGEPVENNTFNYFDFRAGGLFTGTINDYVSLYAGGAYYHFTKPEETFLVNDQIPGDNNTLDPRMVFHAGGSIFVNDKFSISPSGLFMSQTGNREISAGAAFGYHFNQSNRYRRGGNQDNSAVYLGSWYRFGDALVLLLGVDFKSFKFGFSYDVNISDLDIASLNQGGVELSLIYTGPVATRQKPTKLYCPRF